MDDLQNKTAMITGGVGGMGSEFVHIMLENGAKVAIVDLPTTRVQSKATELEDKYGKGRVVFYGCDITKTKEFEETFKRIVEEFDGLDILVNNAGIMNDKLMDRTIDVNLTSMIRGSLLAMDHMGKHKSGKGGVIVNIASIYGLSSYKCCVPIYAATKYAVVGFSQSLANFHYISGVRVVTLCPGLTWTPMTIKDLSPRVLDFVDTKFFKLNELPEQTPDVVASGLLHILRKSENGTVWVCENAKPPYAVKFSHYSEQAV